MNIIKRHIELFQIRSTLDKKFKELDLSNKSKVCSILAWKSRYKICQDMINILEHAMIEFPTYPEFQKMNTNIKNTIEIMDYAKDSGIIREP